MSAKKFLYFHNDPQEMLGSRTVNERINILKKTEKIIFNSNWSRSRFLDNLPININNEKLVIIPQSTSKTKINFEKKEKNNFFCWKIKYI